MNDVSDERKMHTLWQCVNRNYGHRRRNFDWQLSINTADPPPVPYKASWKISKATRMAVNTWTADFAESHVATPNCSNPISYSIFQNIPEREFQKRA